MVPACRPRSWLQEVGRRTVGSRLARSILSEVPPLSSQTIVFVSDAHFGLPANAPEMERRKSFLTFLQSIHGVERLVIAGDLFQFWFDLGSSMPKGYWNILHGLSLLLASGTRIDYIAGNHDYWRGSFFPEELGVQIHEGSLELQAQNRRLMIVHGDGEGPGDWGYKLLKRTVRSGWLVGLAKRTHPDLLAQIARRMDRASHHHTSKQPLQKERLRAAAQQAWDQGFDAYIMGHVHAQLHEKPDHRAVGQGELVVIGDWLDLCSYVLLKEGTLETKRWQA